MLDNLFTVTFFKDHAASYKAVGRVSLQELGEQIEAEVAGDKKLLPWIKLAEFGNVKTKLGSLRHDDNVTTIAGCEGDYDGEKMSFDDALALLRTADVACILHTSPSHTPQAPRWRVLAPTSKPLAKEHRAQLVARLNGVLGGVLGPESFVISQSYYFGHLDNGIEYRVETLDGRPIDLCAELDAGAIGKHTPKPNGNGATSHQYADFDALKEQVLSGATLHPSIVSIAAVLAGRGWARAQIREYVRLIFDAASQQRYLGRWPECERAIDWVCDREEAKGRTASESPDLVTPTAPLVVDSIAWDEVPVPERKWTVYERIPEKQVCILSGHGASGKSLLGLHLAAAHAAPRNEWLKALVKPGPSLFCDAEEDLDEIHIRLHAITAHYQCSYQDLIKGGLAVKTMIEDAMMAVPNPKTGVVQPTALYRQILEYAGDMKTVQVVIANSANVFAGNENDRSQVQQFAAMLRRIAVASGGSVVLISHPSLAGLSTETGLSGTTQWHNAVRARMWLHGVRASEDDSKEEVADLRVLDFMKNQYGRPQEGLTLRWRDGMFLPEAGVASLDKMAREMRLEEVFLTILKRFWNTGRSNVSENKTSTYAPKKFVVEPEAKAIHAKVKELDAAMVRLLAAGRVKTGSHGRRGAERTHLEPA